MRKLHIEFYAKFAYNMRIGGVFMYKKMYYYLFNAIIDILEMEDVNEIKEYLKKAQLHTEEIYISSDEDD